MGVLAGKIALVTGASSGIGRAAALRLAAEGAVIAALGRSEEETVRTVEDIQKAGGTATPFLADIRAPASVQTALAQINEQMGDVTIVVANAGINGVWSPLDKLEPTEWDDTLETNLKGTFLTLKYALPSLKKAGGSVVIVSSVNGTRMFSNTGATAYACSKAGQVALAKMAALELAPFKIRVNVICPGKIDTPIHESTERRDLEEIKAPVEYPEGVIPLQDGQPGTPEQVAELICFLASDASSLITGTEVWIDGGQSLLQA